MSRTILLMGEVGVVESSEVEPKVPQDPLEIWSLIQSVAKTDTLCSLKVTIEENGKIAQTEHLCECSGTRSTTQILVNYLAPRKPLAASKRAIRFTSKISFLKIGVPSRSCLCIDVFIKNLLLKRHEIKSNLKHISLQFRELRSNAESEVAIRRERSAKVSGRLKCILAAIEKEFQRAQEKHSKEVKLSKLNIGSVLGQFDDVKLIAGLSIRFKVQKLILSKNNICDEGIEILRDVAIQSEELRTVLLLDNPKVSAEAASRLEGQLAINTLIGSLPYEMRDRDPDLLRSLNQRMLGNEGAQILADFLSSSFDRGLSWSHLRVLGLAKAGIGAAGASALGAALKSGSQIVSCLEIIEVYSNLPGSHWADFGASVVSHRRLKSLDLGSNGLTDEDLQIVLEAITMERGYSSLEELHLDYNCLSAESVQLLFPFLRQFDQIHTIWLHGNSLITEDEMTQLNDFLSARQEQRIGIPNPEKIVEDLHKSEIFSNMDYCLEVLPKDEMMIAEGNADEIARLCIAGYYNLCSGHAENTIGQSVVAGFVQLYQGRLSLVSLGVGTRFVDAKLASADKQDNRVKDSHAEVLARRGLRKYLHAQTFKALKSRQTSERSMFFQSNGTWSLRPNVRFYLYTSLAPCGAASSLSLNPAVSYCKGGMGSACAAFQPGERHSCTDKIQRWTRDGLQGKLFKAIFDKVPLTGVVIGRKWSPRCEEVIPNSCGTREILSDLGGNALGQHRGDSDMSIAWWHGLAREDGSKVLTFDGKTGLSLESCTVPISPRWLRMEIDVLSRIKEKSFDSDGTCIIEDGHINFA